MKFPYEISGGLLLTANTFAGLIIAFPVTVLVARNLGPDRMGTYAFVLSFAVLARCVAAMNLQDVVIPRHKREGDDRLYGSAWVLSKGAAIVMSLLVLAAGALVSQTGTPDQLSLAMQILIVVAAYLFSDHEIYSMWCKSEGHYWDFVRLDLGGLLVGLALRIGLVLNGSGGSPLLWSYFAEQVVKSVLAFWLYRRRGRPFLNPFRWSPVLSKQLFWTAMPLWMSSILVVGYGAFDQILLGVLVEGRGQLGQYFVATKFVEAFSAGAGALFVVYLARLAAEPDARDVHLQRLQDLSVWSFVLLVLPLHFSLEWIIVHLYGEQYQQAAALGLVYLWVLPALFLSSARTTFLVSEGLLRLELILKATGVSANLALNLYFIPLYGAVGAVATTLGVHWVVGVLAGLFLPPLRPLNVAMLRAFMLPRSAARLWNWIRLEEGQDI